ncbi:uncharacterized protein LOC129337372 [Eublepharis macularius]|uniref:Vipericidin n=1 Tax=Eublepharis macularius TaxID=481883 RepID=A0AA97L964_EUBMA|nr:uncharacterized protein LOC129337372 [Eublepharis macularius]
MENWILLILSLAVAATALSPPQEGLSYEEAISLAVDRYNQEPGLELAFRLQEAKPQPEWDPSGQSLQELEFTVQETTCPPAKQLNLDECDFKDDGVVKECFGTIFSEQGAPVLQLNCETAGQGHIRVRRGGFRKFVKKVKKAFKKATRPLRRGHCPRSHPRKMESWILLLLGLAVAAVALPPPQEELSYEEAVSSVVDLYNQEPGVELAFRLLEAKPQPEWDPSGQSLQELEFTVQETTCPPAKQLNLDECDFKDDGVVKECHGTIFTEQGAPVIQYLCETADQGHIRVRRGLGKIVKKIKNKIKKGIKKVLPGGGSSIAQGPGGSKTHYA